MAKRQDKIQKNSAAPVKPPANNNSYKKDSQTSRAGQATTLKKQLTPYFPGILLFFIAFIIALLTYKDYGVSYDEQIQRLVGTSSYEYVFHNDQTLKTIEYRDLGAGFELPLVFIEKLFKRKDTRDIYQVRHLVTNLFFLLSVFCGYILALRLFKDQFIACLGFILLAFHPRIYAHSFLNTKDLPFLSVFIIVFLLCQVAFEKNKRGWYLLLGLACGYATSIRAMGILFVPCISGFFIIDYLRAASLKEKVTPLVRNYLLFIVGFCGLLYIAWPILWSNPVHYFIEEFKSLSHINWESEVFLAGKTLDSTKLPWYYVPVWFSITTPELWLILGLAGTVWVLVAFARRPIQFLLNTPERNFLLYLACFIGPVIVVTALNSVNYDDWRHLYFIYPSFVFLALYAVSKIATGKKKLVMAALCILQFGITGFFMVRFHPFQQVYFNNFVSHAPEHLRKNYEMEYWGGSFKQGLDYLLNADKSKSIKIYCEDKPMLDNNIMLLPDDERNRIQFADMVSADYFFTNFRYHPHDYPLYEIAYSIQVLNSTILCVYKLEKDPVKRKQIIEQSIIPLNKLLAKHPDDYRLQLEMGNAYFYIGQYDSSEAHDKKSLEINPKNADVMSNLAGIYFYNKNYPMAIGMYKKATGLRPTSAYLFANIAVCYLYSNKNDSAIYYANKAISVDSSYQLAHTVLAAANNPKMNTDAAKK